MKSLFIVFVLFCLLTAHQAVATSTLSPLNQSFQNIKNKLSHLPYFYDSLQEVEKPVSLTVQGNIPGFVKGFMIKNGPAVFGALPSDDPKVVRRRFTHAFDGLGKLSRFEINGNDVKFSTKFLRTNLYNHMIKNKKDIFPCVAAGQVNPPFNLWQLIKAILLAKDFDNTSVNVVNIGKENDKWLALTDAAIYVQFDPASLDTIQRYYFKDEDKIVPKNYESFFSSAHPKQRTVNGEKYTYSYHVFRKSPASKFSLFQSKSPQNIIKIIRTDTNYQRTIVGSIVIPDGDLVPYVHDISITDNHLIVATWPLYHNFAKMINGKGFMKQLEWKANEPTKIHVFDVSKFDGKNFNEAGELSLNPIASFDAPAAWAYHHINAYEEVDSISNLKTIVMDVTGYDDGAIAYGEHGYLYLDHVKDPEYLKHQERDGTCFRYRLPLTSEALSGKIQKISPNKLQAIGLNGLTYTSDLVRINPQYEKKPYRYSYGVAGFAGDDLPYRGGFLQHGLLKQDHKISESSTTEQSAFVWKEEGCFPSEPLFVTNPEGASEDDGVILSQVFDANKQQSFLLVLNAKTMTEVARAYTGTIIPTSFHGQFSPSS